MSLTAKEASDLENVNHLCMVMHILTNRIHPRMLTQGQRQSLGLALEHLREIEADISRNIEVVP